jgi:hypothetical protein
MSASALKNTFQKVAPRVTQGRARPHAVEGRAASADLKWPIIVQITIEIGGEGGPNEVIGGEGGEVIGSE